MADANNTHRASPVGAPSYLKERREKREKESEEISKRRKVKIKFSERQLFTFKIQL